MKKEKSKSNYIFLGFMFLGMGIGMLFDQTAAGLIIGMGLGFIFSGIYKDLLKGLRKRGREDERKIFKDN